MNGRGTRSSAGDRRACMEKRVIASKHCSSATTAPHCRHTALQTLPQWDESRLRSKPKCLLLSGTRGGGQRQNIENKHRRCDTGTSTYEYVCIIEILQLASPTAINTWSRAVCPASRTIAPRSLCICPPPLRPDGSTGAHSPAQVWSCIVVWPPTSDSPLTGAVWRSTRQWHIPIRQLGAVRNPRSRTGPARPSCPAGAGRSLQEPAGCIRLHSAALLQPCWSRGFPAMVCGALVQKRERTKEM